MLFGTKDESWDFHLLPNIPAARGLREGFFTSEPPNAAVPRVQNED